MVTWSVSTELAFYLAFPFILSAHLNEKRWWWWCVAVYTCVPTLLLGTVEHNGPGEWRVYINPVVRVGEFLAGMLAAMLLSPAVIHCDKTDIAVLGTSLCVVALGCAPAAVSDWCAMGVMAL